MLPPHLQNYLDSWGQHLRRDVRSAQERVLRRDGMGICRLPMQRVGSDCCGLSVETFAFRALGMPHQVQFASDSCPDAKAWSIANACPQAWQDDVMKRSVTDLGPLPLDAYFAGFPCQPSSRQNRKCRRWRDKRSRVFLRCLSTIKQKRPLYSVMENVLGLLKDWRKVEQLFSKHLPEYITFCMRICPTQFGKGVRRPRLWMVSIRRDAAVSMDASLLQRVVGASLAASWKPKLRKTLPMFLLPKGHSLRMDSDATTAMRRPQKRRNGVMKWFIKHANVRQMLKQSGVTLAHRGYSKGQGVLSQREREVLEVAEATRKPFACLAVDVSQSIDRFSAHDMIRPTLTTSSRVACVRQGSLQILSAGEKLLLHSFPLHKVIRPKKIANQAYHRLVGNSQDVMSCALAILVATSLVRWRPVTTSMRAQTAKAATGIPIFFLKQGKVFRQRPCAKAIRSRKRQLKQRKGLPK